MTLSLRLSRAISFNIIGKVISIVTNLILLQFLMTKVSKDIYGIGVIVLTFAGWLSVLDMGVGASVMKYISEFRASGEHGKLEKVFNTSLTFYMGVGLLIGFSLFILSFFYEKVFSIQHEYIEIGRYLFYICSASAFFNWLFIPFREALAGMHRFDIISKVDSLSNITNLAFAYAVFFFTDSFPVYVAVSQATTILYQFSFIYMIKKCLPSLKISFFYFDKKTFMFIMKFSSYILAGMLCNIFIFQTDNILIGIYVAASGVTVYYAASRLQEVARSINALFGGPLMAAFSELEGKKEYDKQLICLFKYTRIETALFVPIVLIMFIFAEQFIINWLGNDFVLSVSILHVLLLWWLFNGTLMTAQSVMTGKGRMEVFLYPNILNAIANLVLSLILVRYLGIIGVALGTSIPMIITTVFLIKSILKRLNVCPSEYWKKSISPNLLYYLMVCIMAASVVSIFEVKSIFLTVSIMGMVYGVNCLIYFQFFLKQDEKAFIKGFIESKKAM